MLKRALRAGLPVGLRKGIAAWLARRESVSSRHWWAAELLRDLEEASPNEFHRFLWKHHLAYAQTYEIDLRFGPEQLHPSRQMLFDDLEKFLQENGVDPRTQVESILDVGCSLGYLLRHLEQDLLCGAERFAGIDIDEYAIEKGRSYLGEQNSQVELVAGDLSEVPEKFGRAEFDIVMCTGVLMYLDQETAAKMMAMLADRTRRFLVLSGLANPEFDNRDMSASQRRVEDQSFVHNFDSMVEEAGFEVRFRRWSGDELVSGNSIYFLIATPGTERDD